MSSCLVLQDAPAVTAQATSWYAVHTRSKHEKKVASELERRGVCTFLPLLSEVRKWSDRRMLVELPLFSCYVFVNIAPSPETRVSVLRTSGVLKFVGGNRESPSIPDSEIEHLQTILAKKVPFAPHPFLQVGQRVRIRGGALDGIEGILSQFRGSNRLVVSVQTIQRSISITVDGFDVEPVGPRNSHYM
jgi:transcription antitermination factor NusG